MKTNLLSVTYAGLFLAFIGCFFAACLKDENSGLTTDPDLKVVPRSPGSYSVNANGILNFPTDSDFHLTATYIFSDSTNANLSTFRSSLGIKTIAIRQTEISDSLDQSTLNITSVASNFSKYKNFIDTLITGGDTLVSNKYGDWSEFLNISNLVLIGGYLYKITDSKVITILDGDINKISTADSLEESDTLNQIIIRASWSKRCDCVVTGRNWTETKVVETGSGTSRFRTTSELIFTNLTTVQNQANYQHKVFPHWTIKTFVHIQRKGTFGEWICEARQIEFNRQLQFRHTFETIPTNSGNNQGNNYWNESTGWLQPAECKFNYRTDYKYNPYIETQNFPPDGYCLAVHTFAQTANITNPVLSNSYFHWLYYALFPLKWPFLVYCPNFWDEVTY